VAHLTFRRVGADDPGRRGKTTNHPAQITTPPHTPNISLRNYSAHGRCHPAERRSKSARRHLAINTLEWQVSAWTSRLPSHHILRSQGQPKCPPGPVGDTSSHRNVDPHILRPCRTPYHRTSPSPNQPHRVLAARGCHLFQQHARCATFRLPLSPQSDCRNFVRAMPSSGDGPPPEPPPSLRHATATSWIFFSSLTVVVFRLPGARRVHHPDDARVTARVRSAPLALLAPLRSPSASPCVRDKYKSTCSRPGFNCKGSGPSSAYSYPHSRGTG
jgi:hypothetical protein